MPRSLNGDDKAPESPTKDAEPVTISSTPRRDSARLASPRRLETTTDASDHDVSFIARMAPRSDPEIGPPPIVPAEVLISCESEGARKDGSGKVGGLKAGKSYPSKVFAFRGTGKGIKGIEFMTKHRKFVSALNEDNLPHYEAGGEDGRKAAEAYEEFLCGMDLINQQEYITQKTHIGDLLCWERQIRVRTNAHTARFFDSNLRERASRPMATPPEECMYNTWPIREATRAYLTRPLETDFTLGGAFSYLMAIGIYLFTLVAQCQEISNLCPTPFICPAGSQTSGFPIVAPPVNARNLTVQPFEGSVSRMSLANFSVQSFNDFWYPVVKKSCALGAPGCFTPGSDTCYEVQWPYVQGKDTDECDRYATLDVCIDGADESLDSCNTSKSAQCALPFMFQGKVYTDCTTFGDNSLGGWCSLSFEDEGRWGHCKVCRGESLPVPDELLSRCELVRGGERGWVWDPFLSDLREEYLDCRCSEARPCRDTTGNPVTDGLVPENIPFNQKVQVDEQKVFSAMHFATVYYEDLHTQTLACLKDVKQPLASSIGLNNLTSFKWATLDDNNKTEVRSRIQECMGTKHLKDSQRCACDTSAYSNWPLANYYAKEDLRQHICRGGTQDTQRCEPVGDTKGRADLTDATAAEGPCGGGGVCVPLFEEQNHIRLSARFGCFFQHPGASEPLGPTYKACAIREGQGGSSVEADVESAQFKAACKVHAGGLTRRSGLLAVWLFKELNLLSAAFVLVGLLCVLLPVLMVLAVPSVIVYHCCIKSSPTRHMAFIGVMVTVNNLLYAQLSVVVSMIINFSTMYRIGVLSYALYMQQVNPSIKDMERKMTSLANTIYGLVLIVTAGTADVKVVTSLMLTMVMLLKAMNEEMMFLKQIAEPLRDFNENRLTTFEAALLWTKVLEDFLTDDVQYNWVQMFRVQEPLRPVFDSKAQDSMKKERIARSSDKVSCSFGRELLFRYQDTVKERCLLRWDAQHRHTDAPDMQRKKRTLFYLQPLDATLAKTFGHDGKDEELGSDKTAAAAGVPKTITSDHTETAQGNLVPAISLSAESEEMLNKWAASKSRLSMSETRASEKRAKRQKAVEMLRARWSPPTSV